MQTSYTLTTVLKALETSAFIHQHYNLQVLQVYKRLLRKAVALIASLPTNNIHCAFVRLENAFEPGLIHEFISPVLYLRLDCDRNGKLAIHYGYEQSLAFSHLYPTTSSFIRLVYKLTMASVHINIEDCIRSDYVIYECANLYAQTELTQLKAYSPIIIKHKLKTEKIKLSKAS